MHSAGGKGTYIGFGMYTIHTSLRNLLTISNKIRMEWNANTIEWEQQTKSVEWKKWGKIPNRICAHVWQIQIKFSFFISLFSSQSHTLNAILLDFSIRELFSKCNQFNGHFYCFRCCWKWNQISMDRCVILSNCCTLFRKTISQIQIPKLSWNQLDWELNELKMF